MCLSYRGIKNVMTCPSLLPLMKPGQIGAAEAAKQAVPGTAKDQRMGSRRKKRDFDYQK